VISINIYEIVFQIINLGILIWLLNRFLSKPLSKFLDKRSASIKHNIDQAEQNCLETEKVLETQKASLKKSHQEAQEIRQQAESAGKKERETILAKTQEESDRMVLNAKKDIELDAKRVAKELTQRTADLTIALTQKIIQKNVDQAENEALINQYLEDHKN